MPAVKESYAKRKERERLMKQHQRELHPKPPPEEIHVPACSSCVYCVARQIFLQRNRKAKCRDSMRLQWVCTHPLAHNKAKRNNALGEPQKVSSQWEMEPPYKIRPRWCPIMPLKDGKGVKSVQ